MKGWTTENGSDMSTDLPDSSSVFSTNTVTEFEDPSTVANITDAYTVAEQEQHTSEYRTMRDLTVTKLTEQELSRTDQDTTETGSNGDSTYISTTSRAGERTLLSIISNSTSTYEEDTSSSISGTHDITGQQTETGVTSISGTHDITGQETETGVTSISGTHDITGQETETGVTSISGTHDITGQETETGVTSISGTHDITGQETETGVTSISGTHDITVQETETGVTQHRESSEDGVSTQSVHSTATSDELSTNATQEEGVNTKDSLGSGITQFHTGQPTVTGTNFESMAKTSNPSSTPPLTVINSSDSEVDITANSSTNQNYADISSSSSFVPPLVSEITHTSVSQRYIETAETSTGPVITSTDEKPNEPMTFKEETTIPGLTVVPSTLWAITTSVDKSQSTQQTFISQTDSPPEPTTVLSTLAEPSTRMPALTVEDKHKGSTVPVTSTTLDSMGTTAVFTIHQFQASTTTEAQSTPHSTLSATETTKKTAPTTEKHHPTTGTATPSLSASSSQSGPGATDVSTLHFENSTATPGSTTSHRQHTTASYNKTTSTTSTAAISTGNHTATKATTTEMPEKLSLTPGHMCKPQMCGNGGKCVLMSVGYRCECLPGWRGENCREDVDECASNPCPQKSKCVNTRGSFSCYCDFGYDMQDGRSCTKTKTFLVIFSINGSLHESHTEILQLLNASLSNLHGYRRSTLLNLESLEILTVNMFSMSANVTRNDIFQRIQTSITNCNNSQSHCSLKLQYHLPYQVLSLCVPQDKGCDTEYGVWNDTNGTPYCQCHEEYFKNKQRDSTPRDCGNGFKLVNGTCIECPFGFGGFNCNNFYELIAKVVSPAAGGLLLIIIIALIIACCRKDKNDINKIIFKSGDLPMSPCGEFPKSNRVSMEWGRETIEMQENGSTKNLLQMTDIYYSPALRNADLERNGLYPFLGLPGSRHSCIYPAQWNPSFINDDTRRRDYF
ncbi:protein HEG [Clarias gariepinus]